MAGPFILLLLGYFLYILITTAQRVPSPGEFRDVERFIAHAGGEVEGHKYTNSLDALDQNYRRGFRLFELDIMKTADNRFVAAHDWRTWSDQTGHSSDAPPTLEEFMARPILGRYAPLDMAAINAWFENHPDAFLVTDKINDAGEFAEAFRFSDRLMMELFSTSAIEDARKSGPIVPLANFELLRKFHGRELEMLRQHQVVHVASSWNFMAENPGLAYELAQAGVRVYLFNLHAPPEYDELHVFCHDLDLAYGMYADRWDFNESPNCSVRSKTLATLIERSWSRFVHEIFSVLR